MLTNSDLWEMVRGTAGRGPTGSVWLQGTQTWYSAPKICTYSLGSRLHFEGAIGRVLNGRVANVDARAPKGKVTDVDEETVNEARRIGLRMCCNYGGRRLVA